MLYSQGAPTSVEWPVVAGSPGGMRYSPLKQINASNVNQLQVAWTYDVSDGAGTLETNPIVVDGVLYGYTPAQKVFAVNAATGKQIWQFDSGTPARGNNRGRRLLAQRIGRADLRAAFASTCMRSMPRPASRMRSGAVGGRIDFRADLRGGPEGTAGALGHPPVIYKDLVIFAGRTGETLPVAPGDVRAYDARTGKLRWTFHTVPHPGEYGYDTWPKDAWTYSGQCRVLAGHEPGRAARHRLRATSNPVNMFIGRDRLGDNLFANSLLALDANTGKRIWHFQTVKHDIWDRDLPSPPSLVTVRRDGKNVDAVAITTKTGHVFVFDRTNGTPLFPIEYKKVSREHDSR